MRKFLLAAAAGAALIGAGVAFAQSDGALRPPGAHHRMEELNSNNDNSVSRTEFDAGQRARFAQMDANSDGNLTREERRAGRPERPNRDANNDGAITRDEFLAGPNQMFDRLDANRDGSLTGEERQHDWRGGDHRRGGHGMRGADADRDGTVSLAEFTARGATMFDHMDSNDDGQLTQADRDARRAAHSDD